MSKCSCQVKYKFQGFCFICLTDCHTSLSCITRVCPSEKQKASQQKITPRTDDTHPNTFQDDVSVLKIIGSEEKSPTRQTNVDDELITDNHHTDVNTIPRSRGASPGKRSYAEFIQLSPSKSETPGIYKSDRKASRSTCLSSQNFGTAKESQSENRSSRSNIHENVSPIPSSDLVFGSAQSQDRCNAMRSKKSFKKCSHPKDSSPVRCDECYSPNRYKDELDAVSPKDSKVKQVRFENVSSTDESRPLSRRSNSEGDSEGSFESISTWPPKKWNEHQSEDVILYDHCGRTASRYHPSHTVSLIHCHDGEEGLEEEMDACRKRALRKHEETLRERRGCRAMYRQRLRAEFSCMMSDLANLDKQSRLARLESDAKSSLLPKKQKNGSAISNKVDAEKDDEPGRVKVMDCIDSPQVDIDVDKKTCETVLEKEVDDCNLEALDQLLTSLKEQRDYLLACQQAEGEKAAVQSVSVQCEDLKKTDHATSPRVSSPAEEVQREDCIDQVKSRSISPIYPTDPENSNNTTNKSYHSSTVVGISSLSSPMISDDSNGYPSSRKQSPKTLKHKKCKEDINRMTASKEMTTVSLNTSKKVSPAKVTNESSSSMSVDATSYSFDGVKVEVKVTKNKTRRTEKKIEIRTDKLKENDFSEKSSPAIEGLKSDSWAKKLTENNSSGSTAYLSPPDELNTDEHKLLISILEGMKKKNDNPILRMYIQKLLSMSKGSLENMSITMSDDSVKSDGYKSCQDSMRDITNKESSRSYVSVISQEDDVLPSTVPKSSKDKVRIILDSDDSRDTQETNKTEASDKKSCPSPDLSKIGPQCLGALKHYNNRLQLLTKLMSQQGCTSVDDKYESDTAYLQIPSDLEESIKIPQELSLPPPEESLPVESKDTSDKLPSGPATTSDLGVGLNLLPKPDSMIVRQPPKKTKPPSTIKNNVPRRVLSQSVIPHELSTIAEVDSKLTSLHRSHKQHPSSIVDHEAASCTSAGDNGRSEGSESYHTLPPAGIAPISSDSSFISSGSVSPVKPANESSLQIFTDLPNSSFGGSSVEELAVSEVFRSLGIGWAVSTWRKTQEASRKHQESSSSNPSDPVTVPKKKKEESRYRHSTPIKFNETEKNTKLLESEEDRLTPPSVSLYQRYQNLICSNIDSSSQSSES